MSALPENEHSWHYSFRWKPIYVFEGKFIYWLSKCSKYQRWDKDTNRKRFTKQLEFNKDRLNRAKIMKGYRRVHTFKIDGQSDFERWT